MLSAFLSGRWWDNQLSIGVQGGFWAPAPGAPSFGQIDVWTAWRSETQARLPQWRLLVEGSTTSAASPLDLWNGAGTGAGRAPLLRAHPLLNGNIIDGPVFGRTLAHATAEYQRPVMALYETTVRVAGFVDTAQAWHRLEAGASQLYVDAGFGLRWEAPGVGIVRLDIARGVVDGRLVASAGWQAPWPHQ